MLLASDFIEVCKLMRYCILLYALNILYILDDHEWVTLGDP